VAGYWIYLCEMFDFVWDVVLMGVGAIEENELVTDAFG
jgi:hypothetical protein